MTSIAVRALLACLLALSLVGCGAGGASDVGSGGGGGSDGGAAKPATVLVEVDDDDLEDLLEETGSAVVRQIPGTDVREVTVPAGMTENEFLALLDDDVRVVEAEEDAVVDNPEGGATTIPAGTTELAASIRLQPELVRIGLAPASARSRGQGVVVAIVDTGVDASHPFLAGAVDPVGFDLVDRDDAPEEERNLIDDDLDGLVDEGYGHGTFVASLIHAVAPEARLIAFRVLNSDGFGSTSGLAEGITRAADAGAHVINVSIGMQQQAHVVKRAVEYARALGAVVVASVGNGGQDSVAFPSALSDTFAITAVDATDLRATFASYGSGVDLAAPGSNLLGAHPGFSIGTARWSGTSFAAALVSGACAMVRALDPSLDAHALEQVLEGASVDIDGLDSSVAGKLGRGRLDLDAATRP